MFDQRWSLADSRDAARRPVVIDKIIAEEAGEHIELLRGGDKKIVVAQRQEAIGAKRS